ncbi:MAG: RluA family pseudouridine synthase [Desulfobulbaceae bacterium]|nr:RluA family pseudouridine synthase [Desulfobulbaceae bacterium]
MSKPTNPTPRPRNLPLGMTILHEDRDILVVNKPSGLLTMGTDAQKERTAYFMLTDYVRKGASKSKLRIFIVHRLDRDTSGVLVFAKTEEAKQYLQENWEANQKQYLAIVHGHCREKSGTVDSYLIESSALKVYATNDRVKGKAASTSYRVLKEVEGLSLLAVTPHTGRKNQIRVHLADLGHPIIGDKKYGVEKDGYKKLALHAASLTFTHPFRKELCTFIAPPPGWYQRLVGKIGAEWYQEKKNGPELPAASPAAPATIPGAPESGKVPGKIAAGGRPARKPRSQGNRQRATPPPRRRKQDG